MINYLIILEKDERQIIEYSFKSIDKKQCEFKISDKLKEYTDLDVKYKNDKIFKDPEIIELITDLTPKINYLIEYVQYFMSEILYSIALNSVVMEFNNDEYIEHDEEYYKLPKFKDYNPKVISRELYNRQSWHFIIFYYVFCAEHQLNINKNNIWLFDIIFLLNAYNVVFMEKSDYSKNDIKPKLDNRLADLYCLIHNQILFNLYNKVTRFEHVENFINWPYEYFSKDPNIETPDFIYHKDEKYLNCEEKR